MLPDAGHACPGWRFHAWARRTLFSLLVVLSFLAAFDARALTWEETHGGTVLQIRDCGHQDKDRPHCKAQLATDVCTGGFCAAVRGYRGDGALLAESLARKRYREVWLFSGGGHVEAGIDVGMALRDATATVVVPTGQECVSACTIAFMGGMFRRVDDPYAFRVHAASSFSRLKIVDAFLSDAAGNWQTLAKRHYQEVAKSVVRLTSYFNDFSRTPVTQRTARANLDAIDAALERCSAPRANSPLERVAVEICIDTRDRADAWAQEFLAIESGMRGGVSIDEQLRLEGAARRQGLAMSIERRAARNVIDQIRKRLGSDLDTFLPGIAMVESMYSTTIADVFDPSQVVLRNRGYVTTIVGGDKP